MLSDCRILGIPETDDPTLIKSAYRKRMKELHPDLSEDGDSFGKHALLVQINQAYNRLIRSNARNPIEAQEKKRPQSSADIAAHADPAYVYYKTGLSFYMKIHPSEWDFEKSGMLNIKISEDDQEQILMREKIKGLVKLFPKAYYYFSIVVNEYPDSMWANDAQEKMGKIEERTKRYRKIIESFSTWNPDKKAQAEKHKTQFEKHRQTRQGLAPETEKRWKS